MLTFLKSNLRRMAIACLVAIVLFSGSALGIGNNNLALAAETLKRDTVDLPNEESINNAEYESAKAKRRAMQAQMSQQAEDNDRGESATEKLNLNESTPRTTKKFFEQVEGDEPINNETRP